MEKGIIMHVKIECTNHEMRMAIGEYIHDQLVGNMDYVNNNIILNIEVDYEVNLWVFEGCKDLPPIKLPDFHWRTLENYKNSAIQTARKEIHDD